MTDRPDYVKCIKSPFEDERGRFTLCGAPASGFDFIFGLDHLYCHAIGQGRLLACSACVNAAIAALEASRDTNGRRDPKDRGSENSS